MSVEDLKGVMETLGASSGDACKSP
jgi:hypothetical protein